MYFNSSIIVQCIMIAVYYSTVYYNSSIINSTVYYNSSIINSTVYYNSTCIAKMAKTQKKTYSNMTINIWAKRRVKNVQFLLFSLRKNINKNGSY